MYTLGDRGRVVTSVSVRCVLQLCLPRRRQLRVDRVLRGGAAGAWAQQHPRGIGARPRVLPAPFGLPWHGDVRTSLVGFVVVEQVVRSQPYVTLNPEHACVFVPPFDTTPLPQRFIRGGFATFGNGAPVTEALQRLPHWNNGTNHVVLDWTDSRALYFDAGNAVVWKTGYDMRHYRRGHDIAFPLFPNVAVDPAHRQRPNFHETRDVLV